MTDFFNLFKCVLVPPNKYENGPGSISYSVSTLEDGRRWLLLQGTVEPEDIRRDLSGWGRTEEGGWIFHDGFSRAADWLLKNVKDFDYVSGYSLGAGQAQIVGILSGKPWIGFGSPRVIYGFPKDKDFTSNGFNIIARGDPIAFVSPWGWYGGSVLKIGPLSWPKLKNHYCTYYLKLLKSLCFE